MGDKDAPEDSSGHVCDLCGAISPSVFCGPCNKRYFCRSCDDMYHTHPKRQMHDRQPIIGVIKDAPIRPPKKRSALRSSTDNLEGSATSLTEKVKAASSDLTGIPTPPPKRRPKMQTPSDSPVGSTTSLSSLKDKPSTTEGSKDAPIAPPKRRSRVQTPVEGVPVGGSLASLSSLPEICIDSSAPVAPPKRKSQVKSPTDITSSSESISKSALQAAEVDIFKVPPVPPPRRSHSQTSIEKIPVEGVAQNIPEDKSSSPIPPARRSRLRTPDSTGSLPSLPDSKEALFYEHGPTVPLPPKRRSHMRTPDSITSLPAMSLHTKAMFAGDSSTVPIPPKRHLKSPDSTTSLPTLPDHKETTFLRRSDVPTPPPRKTIRASSSITSLPNFTVEYTTAPTPPPKRRSRLQARDSTDSLGYWRDEEKGGASHSPTPPPRRKKRELEGSNLSLQSPSGHKRECHWSELTKEEQQYYIELEDSLLRERGILQSSENIVPPPRKGKPESLSALVLSKIPTDERSSSLPRSAEYSEVIKHPTVAHVALRDEVKDWSKVTSAPDVRNIEQWLEFKHSDEDNKVLKSGYDGRTEKEHGAKVSEDSQRAKENISSIAGAAAVPPHIHHAHHHAYAIPTLYSLASAHTSSCPQCYTSSWSSLTSPPEDWQGKKDEVAMHQHYHAMHEAGMKRSHSAMHEHALMHPGYLPAGTGLYPYGAISQVCPHGHRSPLSYTTDSSSHSSSCQRRPRKRRSGSRKKREKDERHKTEASRSESEGEADAPGYTSEETKEVSSEIKSPPLQDTKKELNMNWTCQHCTYINAPGTNICEMCCKTNFELPSPTEDLSERRPLSFGDEELTGVKRKTKAVVQSEVKELTEDKLITGEKLQSEVEETSTKTAFTDTHTEEDTSSVAASYLTSGSQGYITSEFPASEMESSQIEREVKRSFSASPSQTGEYKDSSCQTSHESLAEFSSRENLSPAELGRQLRQVASDVSPQTSPLLARKGLRHPTPPPHGFPLMFGKGIGRSHHGLSRSTAHGDLTTASQGLLPHEPVHDSSGYGTTDSLYHSWSHPSLIGDASRVQERTISPRPLSPRIGEYSRVESALSASDGVRVGHSLHRSRSNWESDPGQLSRSAEQIIEYSKQQTEDHSEDLMNLIREAEQYGFTIEDVQVSLERCGRDDPLVWLEQNWQAMIENVAVLATDYSEDRDRIEIGIISPNEARDALRSHRGDIRLAVLECVESRKSKIEELTARGNFNEDDIAEALTANQGSIELAYTDLVKSTLQPFVTHALEEEKQAKYSEISAPGDLIITAKDEQPMTEIHMEKMLPDIAERRSPSLISKLQCRMTEKEREERERELIKQEEITDSGKSTPFTLDKIQTSETLESLRETDRLKADMITLPHLAMESSQDVECETELKDFVSTGISERTAEEMQPQSLPITPQDDQSGIADTSSIVIGTENVEQHLSKYDEPQLSYEASYPRLTEDNYKSEYRETVRKQTSLELPSMIDKGTVKKQSSLESAIPADKEIVKKQSSLEFDKTAFRENITKHASLEFIRGESRERFKKQTSLESAKDRKPTSVTARPLIALIPKSSKYEDDFSRVISSELLAEEFGVFQPDEETELMETSVETSMIEETQKTEEKHFPVSQEEILPEQTEIMEPKQTDDSYLFITEEKEDDFVDAPGVAQVEDIVEFGSDKYGDYGFASPAAQLYASIIQSTETSSPKKKKRALQHKIGKDEKQKNVLSLKRETEKPATSDVKGKSTASPSFTWVSPGRTIISEDKWSTKPPPSITEVIAEEPSEDMPMPQKDLTAVFGEPFYKPTDVSLSSGDRIAASALSDTDSLPSDAYTDAFEEPTSPPPFPGYKAFSDTDSLASDAYTDAPEPASPPSCAGYKTFSDSDSLMSDAFTDALEEPSSPPAVSDSKLQFPVDSRQQEYRDSKDFASLSTKAEIIKETSLGATSEIQQEITAVDESKSDDTTLDNVESWAVASLYESLMSDIIVEKKPSKQKPSKLSAKVSKTMTAKKEPVVPVTDSVMKHAGEKYVSVSKEGKTTEMLETSIASTAEKLFTDEKISEASAGKDISFVAKELETDEKDKKAMPELPIDSEYKTVTQALSQLDQDTARPHHLLKKQEEPELQRFSEEALPSEIGMEPESSLPEMKSSLQYSILKQEDRFEDAFSKIEYDIHEGMAYRPTDDVISQESFESLEETKHDLAAVEETTFFDALQKEPSQKRDIPSSHHTDKSTKEHALEELEVDRGSTRHEAGEIVAGSYTISDEYSDFQVVREGRKRKIEDSEKAITSIIDNLHIQEITEHPIETVADKKYKAAAKSSEENIRSEAIGIETTETKPEELSEMSQLEHDEKFFSSSKKTIKADDKMKKKINIEGEEYVGGGQIKLHEKTVEISDSEVQEPMQEANIAQMSNILEKGVKAEVKESVEENIVSLEQKAVAEQQRSETEHTEEKPADRESGYLVEKITQEIKLIEENGVSLEQKAFKIRDVTQQGMKADTLELVEGAVSLEQKSLQVTDVTPKEMKTDTLEFVEGAVSLEQKSLQLTDVTPKGMKADTQEFVEGAVSLEQKSLQLTDITPKGMKADTQEFVEGAVTLEQKSLQLTDVTPKGMKADTQEFVEGAVSLEQKSLQLTDVAPKGMKADTQEFVEGAVTLEQKSLQLTDVAPKGMKADTQEFVEGAVTLEQKSLQLTDVAPKGIKADTQEFVEGAVTLEQKSVQLTDTTPKGIKADTQEFVEGAVSLEQKSLQLTDVTLKGMKTDTLEFVEGAVTLEQKYLQLTDVTPKGMKADTQEFVEGAVTLEQKSLQLTDVTPKGMKTDALEFVEGAVSLEQKSLQLTDVTPKGMKTDALEFVEGAVSLEQKSLQLTDVASKGMKADTHEFVEGAVTLEQKYLQLTDVTPKGMKTDTLEFVEGAISLEQKSLQLTDVTPKGMKADTLEFVEEAVSLQQKSFQLTDVTQKAIEVDTLEFMEGAVSLEQTSLQLTDVTPKGMKADILEFVEGAVSLEQKSLQITDVAPKGMKADTLEFMEGAVSLEQKSLQLTDVTPKEMKADTLEFVEEAVSLEQKSLQLIDVTPKGMKADTLEFMEGAVSLEQKSLQLTDVTPKGMKADTLEFVEEAVSLEQKSLQLIDVTPKGMIADTLEFMEGAVSLERKSLQLTDVTPKGMKADTLEFVEEAVSLEQKSLQLIDVTPKGMIADTLEFMEGAVSLERKSLQLTDVTPKGMKADTLEFVEEAVSLEQKSLQLTDVTPKGMKADTLEFVEEAVSLEQKSLQLIDVTPKGMKAHTLEFVEEAVSLEQKSLHLIDVTPKGMKADTLEFMEGAVSLEQKSLQLTDVTPKGMKADSLEFVEEAVSLEQKSLQLIDVTPKGMKADTLEFVEGAVSLEQKSLQLTDVTPKGMKADILKFVEGEAVTLEMKSLDSAEDLSKPPIPQARRKSKSEKQKMSKEQVTKLESSEYLVETASIAESEESSESFFDYLTSPDSVQLKEEFTSEKAEALKLQLKADSAEVTDVKSLDSADANKPPVPQARRKSKSERRKMSSKEDITKWESSESFAESEESTGSFFDYLKSPGSALSKDDVSSKTTKVSLQSEVQSFETVPSKIVETAEDYSKPPVPQIRRKSKSERRKMTKDIKWESSESLGMGDDVVETASMAESEESAASFFDYLKSADSVQDISSVKEQFETSKSASELGKIETVPSKSPDSSEIPSKPPIPHARRRSKSDKRKISKDQVTKWESSESFALSEDAVETASIAESEESAGSFFDYLKSPDSAQLKEELATEKSKALKLQSEMDSAETISPISFDAADVSKPPVPQARRKSKSEKSKMSKEQITKWESTESFPEESTGSFFDYLKSPDSQSKEDLSDEKPKTLTLLSDVESLEVIPCKIIETAEDLGKSPVPKTRRKSKSERRKVSKDQDSKWESSESFVMGETIAETASIAKSEESVASFDYLKSPDTTQVDDGSSFKDQFETQKLPLELSKPETIPTALDSEEISAPPVPQERHKLKTEREMSIKEITKCESSESFAVSEDIADRVLSAEGGETTGSFFDYIKSPDKSKSKEMIQHEVKKSEEQGIVAMPQADADKTTKTPDVKEEISKPPVPTARRKSKSDKRKTSKEQIAIWESSESIAETASLAESEESAGSYFEYLSSAISVKHKQEEESDLLQSLDKPTAPQRKSKTLERKPSKSTDELFMQSQSKSMEVLSTEEKALPAGNLEHLKSDVSAKPILAPPRRKSRTIERTEQKKMSDVYQSMEDKVSDTAMQSGITSLDDYGKKTVSEEMPSKFDSKERTLDIEKLEMYAEIKTLDSKEVPLSIEQKVVGEDLEKDTFQHQSTDGTSLVKSSETVEEVEMKTEIDNSQITKSVNIVTEVRESVTEQKKPTDDLSVVMIVDEGQIQHFEQAEMKETESFLHDVSKPVDISMEKIIEKEAAKGEIQFDEKPSRSKLTETRIESIESLVESILDPETMKSDMSPTKKLASETFESKIIVSSDDILQAKEETDMDSLFPEVKPVKRVRKDESSADKLITEDKSVTQSIEECFKDKGKPEKFVDDYEKSTVEMQELGTTQTRKEEEIIKIPPRKRAKGKKIGSLDKEISEIEIKSDVIQSEPEKESVVEIPKTDIEYSSKLEMESKKQFITTKQKETEEIIMEETAIGKQKDVCQTEKQLEKMTKKQVPPLKQEKEETKTSLSTEVEATSEQIKVTKEIVCIKPEASTEKQDMLKPKSKYEKMKIDEEISPKFKENETLLEATVDKKEPEKEIVLAKLEEKEVAKQEEIMKQEQKKTKMKETATLKQKEIKEETMEQGEVTKEIVSAKPEEEPSIAKQSQIEKTEMIPTKEQEKVKLRKDEALPKPIEETEVRKESLLEKSEEKATIDKQEEKETKVKKEMALLKEQEEMKINKDSTTSKQRERKEETTKQRKQMEETISTKLVEKAAVEEQEIVKEQKEIKMKKEMTPPEQKEAPPKTIEQIESRAEIVSEKIEGKLTVGKLQEQMQEETKVKKEPTPPKRKGVKEKTIDKKEIVEAVSTTPKEKRVVDTQEEILKQEQTQKETKKEVMLLKEQERIELRKEMSPPKLFEIKEVMLPKTSEVAKEVIISKPEEKAVVAKQEAVSTILEEKTVLEAQEEILEQEQKQKETKKEVTLLKEQKRIELRKEMSPPKLFEIKEVMLPKASEEAKEVIISKPEEKAVVAKQEAVSTILEAQEEILEQEQKQKETKKEVTLLKEQERIELRKEMSPPKQFEVKEAILPKASEAKEVIISKPEEKVVVAKQEAVSTILEAQEEILEQEQKQKETKKEVTLLKEQKRIELRKEMSPPKLFEIKEVMLPKASEEAKEVIISKPEEKAVVAKQEAVSTILEAQEEILEQEQKQKETKKEVTLLKELERIELRKEMSPPKQFEVKEAMLPKASEAKEVIISKPEEKVVVAKQEAVSTILEAQEEILEQEQKQKETKKEVTLLKEQEIIELRKEMSPPKQFEVKEVMLPKASKVAKEVITKPEEKTIIAKQEDVVREEEKKKMGKKEVTPPNEQEKTSMKKELTSPKQKELKETLEVRKEIVSTKPEQKPAAETQKEFDKQEQKEREIRKELTTSKEQEKMKVGKEVTPIKPEEEIALKVAKQKETEKKDAVRKAEQKAVVEKEDTVKQEQKEIEVKKEVASPKEKEKTKLRKETTPPKQTEIKEVTPPKAIRQGEVEKKLDSKKLEEEAAVAKQKDMAKQEQRQMETKMKKEVTPPKEQEKMEARKEVISPKSKETTEITSKAAEQKEMLKKDALRKTEQKAAVEKQETATQEQKQKEMKNEVTPPKEIEKMKLRKETTPPKRIEIKEVTPPKAIEQMETENKLASRIMEEKVTATKQDDIVKQEQKQRETKMKKEVTPPKEQEKMEAREEVKSPKSKEEIKEVTSPKGHEEIKIRKESLPPKEMEMKEVAKGEVKPEQKTETFKKEQKQKETKVRKEVTPPKEQEVREDVKPTKPKEAIKEVTLPKATEQKEMEKEDTSRKAEQQAAVEKQEIVKRKKIEMKKDVTPPKEQEKTKLRKETTPPKQREIKEVISPEAIEQKKMEEKVDKKAEEEVTIAIQETIVKHEQRETKEKKEVTPPKEREEVRKEMILPKSKQEMKKVTLSTTTEQAERKTEDFSTETEQKAATEKQETLKQKVKTKKEVTPPKERVKMKLTKETTPPKQTEIKEVTPPKVIEVEKEIVPIKTEEKATVVKQEVSDIKEQKLGETKVKKEVTPPKEEEKMEVRKEVSKLKEEIKEVASKEIEQEEKQVASAKPEEIKKEIIKQEGKDTKLKKEVTPPKEQEEIKLNGEVTPPKQKEKKEHKKSKITEDINVKRKDISQKSENGIEETSITKSMEEDKLKKTKSGHRKKRERKTSLQAKEDKFEEKEVMSKIVNGKASTQVCGMSESEAGKSKLTNGFVLEREKESFEIRQRKIKADKEKLSSQEEMLVEIPHDDSTLETLKTLETKVVEVNSRRRRPPPEQETIPRSFRDENDYQRPSSSIIDKKERILRPHSEEIQYSLKQEEEVTETSHKKEIMPSGLPPRPKPRSRPAEKLYRVSYETPISVRHRVYPESNYMASIQTARTASSEISKVISVSERLLERRQSRELQRKRFHSLSVERPIPFQTTQHSRSADRAYLRKEHYDTYHIPLSRRDISREEWQYKSPLAKRDTSRERTIYRPSSVDFPSFPSRSISPPQAPPRVRRSTDYISTIMPRISSSTHQRGLYASSSKECVVIQPRYDSLPSPVERKSSLERDLSPIIIKKEEISIRAFEPYPRWSSLYDFAGTTNVHYYKKPRRRTDEPCFVRSTSVRDITAEDERYISAFKRLRQMINEPPQPPPRTIREMRKDRNIHYSSLTNFSTDAVPTPPPRLRHTDHKYIPRTVSMRDIERESRKTSVRPIVMNETIRTSQELLRRSSDAKRMFRIVSSRERSREPEGRVHEEIITRQSSYQPISYSLMDINKQGALHLPSDQQDISYVRRDGACSSPVLAMYESKHARQRSLTRDRQSRESSRPSSPEVKTEASRRSRYLSPTGTAFVQRSVSPMKILRNICEPNEKTIARSRDITQTRRSTSTETSRYVSPTKDRVSRRSVSPMTRLKHICDADEQADRRSRTASPTQERTGRHRYAAQMLPLPTSQLFIPGHISRWSTSRRHRAIQDTRRPSVTREDEEPMDQATIAAKLTEMNFTEDEAFQAAQHCDTIYQAVKFLQQHCDMCNNDFPANQMGAMVYCSHKACQECLKSFFTTEILDRRVDDLLCPFCEEPDLTDENISHDYFNHLEIMLKNLVDPKIHELFQQKLRDKVLMKNPDFHWCSQCLSGILSSPDIVKIVCPDCKAVTCARCHWLWDDEHDGRSCLEFQSLKEAQSEDVAEGPERQVEGQGIVCPQCHQRYRLAKGGCLQFHCNMCRSFYCSGCRKLYHKGKMCGASIRCYNLGWHAHHPRNCLFFLRDKEPEQLQEHLKKNKLPYETEPPYGYIVKERCPVHVQKYSPKGWLPDVCGKTVEEKSFGLCKIHYVEYLVGLINKRILDPVAMMNIDDLKLMLRKSRIPFPERRRDELDSSYRIKLLKVIWQELPLEKLEGS